MINAGDDAPDFLVRSTTDRSIWLRSMRGRPVVLHFFPKAPSPIRNALIESFAESFAELKACGAEVIGILLDDLDEQQPEDPPPPRVKFNLVTDNSTQIARSYGVFRRLLSAEKPVSYGLSEAGIVEVVFQSDPTSNEPHRELLDWARSRVPVDHESTARPASRMAGEIIADRYQLKRRLAEGGIGVVWVAEHLGLRQEVAIKLLKESKRADPDHAIHVLERFRHEAQVSALLGRRTLHVIHAQDAGFSEVGPYLVMELVDGHTLADEIDTMGPLSPERFLPILEQVAEALTVAHDVGVIHRDLKPTNILLVDQRAGGVLAKVADFGLAKTINQELTLDRPQETGESTVVGTVDFMSPEQLRAGQKADPRMDVWALGVVTYEALTAKLPFEGPSVHAIMAKIVSSPFPRASSRRASLPVALDAWFDRALAKSMKNRFASPLELVAAYRKAIQNKSPETDDTLPAPGKHINTLMTAEPQHPDTLVDAPSFQEAEQPSETPRKKRRRIAVLTGIAAGLLIGGAIASFLGLRYGMRSDPAPQSSAAKPTLSPAPPPLPVERQRPASPSEVPTAPPGGDAVPPSPTTSATGAEPRPIAKPKSLDPSSVY